MDKNDTKKLFRLFRSIYKNADEFKDDNIDTLLAWSIALGPYRYDDVREAFFKLVRTSPFVPKIAELCGMIDSKTQVGASLRRGAGYEWQALIDSGRYRDAADDFGNASRYAREQGITWEEAKLCEASS